MKTAGITRRAVLRWAAVATGMGTAGLLIGCRGGDKDRDEGDEAQSEGVGEKGKPNEAGTKGGRERGEPSETRIKGGKVKDQDKEKGEKTEGKAAH